MAKITEVPQDKKFWDSEQNLGSVPVGAREIRLSICEKKEKTYLSIREWYRNFEGELAPGKHGLAFRIESTEDLDNLMTLISKGKEYIP